MFSTLSIHFYSHWWIICYKHEVQIKGRSQTNDGEIKNVKCWKGISDGPPNFVISRKQLVTFEEHFQASGYGRASTVKAKHGVWRKELKDAGVRCPFGEVGREKKSSKTEWQMFCGSLTKVVKEFWKWRQVCCFEMIVETSQDCRFKGKHTIAQAKPFEYRPWSSKGHKNKHNDPNLMALPFPT